MQSPYYTTGDAMEFSSANNEQDDFYAICIASTELPQCTDGINVLFYRNGRVAYETEYPELRHASEVDGPLLISVAKQGQTGKELAKFLRGVPCADLTTLPRW